MLLTAGPPLPVLACPAPPPSGSMPTTTQQRQQQKRPAEAAKQREAVAALDALVKELTAFPATPLGVLTTPGGQSVLFNVTPQAGGPAIVLPQPAARMGA